MCDEAKKGASDPIKMWDDFVREFREYFYSYSLHKKLEANCIALNKKA